MIVVDTLLTVAIAIGLRRCKGGWRTTDKLIQRVIMYVPILLAKRRVEVAEITSYTVETQMVPTIAAITMSIQCSVDSYTLMAFLYM
jgi:hypothetical protein